MELHQLTKATTKEKRRLGQGHGSGRVKTSGRGTKGQKARTKIARNFEGGALPLTKRLPFLRGKSRNNSLQAKPIVINLADLNTLPKNAEVTTELLIAQGIIDATEIKRKGVKILGDGELTVPLVFKLPVSKRAQEKISKAGGRVEALVAE
jgi:large subunit ribosomal protein L15